MNMKKMTVFLLLTVLVGTGLLVGCKNNAGTKVINLWYWDQNADPVYNQFIAEYESQNPGIKIAKSVTPWADYWTKLQTALPTGTGPDVFWLNHPNAVSYLPTGLVMDLESIAGDIHFENFNENFYKPFSYQGKRYGVPIFWDTIILFYNKALFDKAGIAYPNENWTWTELYNAAQVLTIRDGTRTTQYGVIAAADPQSGFTNFVYQNGGRLFSDDRMRMTINSPEAREAIQLNLDLIYKYGCAPTPQILSETSSTTLFMSGAAAMLPEISANMSQYANVLGKNLQIAPLPKQKQRASVYHNIAYVASAKTKYPEEVKKLMVFLASREHADTLSKVWAPCFTGTTEQHFSAYNWINARYISEAIQYGVPLPISGKNAGAVYTLLNVEMSKIFATPQLGNRLAALENIINAEIAK